MTENERKLGGKNGNLKCKCGKLRYPRLELCPACYYGSFKWWAVIARWCKPYGYDLEYVDEGDLIAFCVRARDVEHARRLMGDRTAGTWSYTWPEWLDRERYLRPEETASFDSEKGALEWLLERGWGTSDD